MNDRNALVKVEKKIKLERPRYKKSVLFKAEKHNEDTQGSTGDNNSDEPRFRKEIRILPFKSEDYYPKQSLI